MNDLKIFESEAFGKIRVLEKDGEPWFVAADVCRALGLEQVTRAMDRLDDDERGLLRVTHPQSTLKTLDVNGVNEPGLYHLVLCSLKPEAKAFKRWITHEVIPSIRRHGAYMTPETLEAAIMNPDYLLKVVVALKDEKDKRKALEAANASLTVDLEIARPKAEYFDRLVDRNLLTGLRETAKELGTKEKVFVRFLLDRKYLYRDKTGRLLPYAQYVDDLFTVKECINEKTQWAGTQTMVTPKGRETFRLLIPSAS